MQYAQPPYAPYNPYAQPQPLSLTSIDSTGHRPQMRLFFLLAALASATLYLGGIVTLIVGIAIDDHDLTPALVIGGYLGLLLGAFVLYAKIGIALYWLHGAWKWVPMDQRFGKDGKRYQPGEVFMLLIPYYHFYWVFPINLGLCDAMERLRQQTGGMQTAKRDIAMYAAITEIIPFVSLFVAPFLWLSYMRSIDTMHEEIMASLASSHKHAGHAHERMRAHSSPCCSRRATSTIRRSSRRSTRART